VWQHGLITSVKGKPVLRRLILPITVLALTPGCDRGRTQAEEAVKRLLIDPGSAQFRDVVSYPNGAAERYCGEVNAKNRMGGYVGFTKFYVDMNGPVVVLDPGKVELTVDSAGSVRAWADGQNFQVAYTAMCSNMGTIQAEDLARPAFNLAEQPAGK
jgi:hypothetical protein